MNNIYINLKQKTMKKFLALMIAFGLVSCEPTKKAEEPAVADEPAVEAEAPAAVETDSVAVEAEAVTEETTEEEAPAE